MRYTLRQLEVFLSVAQHESVSRAAETLAMSQSAVSSALADLESQFEIELFDRVGKRLRLSTLGRAIRPRAEALIASATELELALDGKSEVGSIRVGATMTIGDYLAMRLLARFARANPTAKYTLEFANTAEIGRRVANFDVDVGLVEGEIEHADLEIIPWLGDELVVFCAPGHPFARKRAVADDELCEATFIVREPGSGTRQAFDHAMHGLRAKLRIGLELEHTEAIKRAVAEGLGVGCVSRLAVESELKQGILVACRVPQRDFRRRFYLVVRRDKHRGVALRSFLDLCRETARPTPRERSPSRTEKARERDP